MLSKNSALIKLFFFILIFSAGGCKKLIQIDPPVQSITTSQVFSDSANALSALGGLYTNMINSGGSIAFGDGFITTYCGASADELLPFESAGDHVSTNTLNPNNSVFYSYAWAPVYNYIYEANAIINNLPAAVNISTSAKAEFNGEAKFFRAFFYFYLVNLFGDVPLITNTDYKTNTLVARSPAAKVYQLIIQDLKDAQSILPGDYSVGNGERIRVNKWAATALLARAYLYTDKYDSAEMQASALINNGGMFSLVADLNSVFLKNSSESILQWQVNSSLPSGIYNATPEAYNFIRSPSYPPTYYITSQLLNSFEKNDNRKSSWLDSTNYDDGNSVTVYYYPFKYKVGYSKISPNAEVSEYYMVLRLAEQFLIRAEARVKLNNLSGAAEDINAIRNRAGLPNTSAATQTEILAAVAQERRIELFSEWGQRWLDLKRTGQAHAVLSTISYKSQWQDYQQLYPLPISELKTNPNLKQTPGY
jgi:hypothetical protein